MFWTNFDRFWIEFGQCRPNVPNNLGPDTFRTFRTFQTFQSPTSFWPNTDLPLPASPDSMTSLRLFVGVRDLVARGYVIPGGVSQRGVVRFRCFRVARCQTWTILDSGQSPTMSHHAGFWQTYSNYSNFANRPDPLAQNRGYLNGQSRLASYNKAKKRIILGGMSVFAKKMCAFQYSSEHVVIRWVARLSRIDARLIFGPPGHATASSRTLQGHASGADGRPAAAPSG